VTCHLLADPDALWGFLKLTRNWITASDDLVMNYPYSVWEMGVGFDILICMSGSF